MQDVFLCVSLFPLRIMFWRFILTVCLFFFYSWIVFHWVYRTPPLFFLKSIHSLMDIWAVSTFWLLWTVVVPECMSMYMIKLMFSVLWSIYLRGELAGHVVSPRLTFWGNARRVLKEATLPLILTRIVWGLWLLHILDSTCYMSLFSPPW